MAGHSHWAGIKYKKGAADAKRGKLFSKLASKIMLGVLNVSIAQRVDRMPVLFVPVPRSQRAARGAGFCKEKVQCQLGNRQSVYQRGCGDSEPDQKRAKACFSRPHVPKEDDADYHQACDE